MGGILSGERITRDRIRRQCQWLWLLEVVAHGSEQPNARAKHLFEYRPSFVSKDKRSV